ncbi:hypothetical protein [Vibrio phage vB_pir03]|nr:hypothetical protein [Vibrio phage vB_pir03]
MDLRVNKETSFVVFSPKIEELLKSIVSYVHGGPEVVDMENLNMLMELVIANEVLRDFYAAVADDNYDDIGTDFEMKMIDIVDTIKGLIQEDLGICLDKMSPRHIEFLEPKALRIIL